MLKEGPRDWHVVGRADKDQLILVECQLTGSLGAVAVFTKEQWERAGTAQRHAYRWNPAWSEVTELTPSVA